eukprot:2206836-Rhodomonas_salina.2
MSTISVGAGEKAAAAAKFCRVPMEFINARVHVDLRVPGTPGTRYPGTRWYRASYIMRLY